MRLRLAIEAALFWGGFGALFWALWVMAPA